MSSPLDRRRFLARAALGAAALALPRSVFASGIRARPPLRIAVLLSAHSGDRALGLQLGLDEARHAAELIGGAIEMQTAAAHETPAAAAERLLATRPALLIGGDTAAECARLAALAASRGAIYFNVGCEDDALRGAACNAAAYHICPSETMLRQAVAEAGDAAGDDPVAKAWDASLVRFGADTLNERFRKQFGRGMTAEVWTAWVAVKIAWEASLRARSTSGPAIAAFLDSPAAQFDGHKGRALSFRAWNHQLRQPLYVFPRARTAAPRPIEVPPSRAEADIRTSLDRIGVPKDKSTCTFRGTND
jgi:ABC-type branched-subunit amino acid transport system substrate-binding protein